MQIMIECFRTGRVIPTGIDIDQRSFSTLGNFEAKTYCPHCKRLHFWSKADVCVAPSGTLELMLIVHHITSVAWPYRGLLFGTTEK